MSLPPIPPRPTSQPVLSAPPVPPLPPDLRASQFDPPPRFSSPLAAPQAHRFDPGIPENMARALDEQLSINPTRGDQWSPWTQPNTYLGPAGSRQRTFSSPQAPLMSSFNQSLAFVSPQPHPHHARVQSTYGPPPREPVAPTATPSLTAPLPVLTTLHAALPSIQNPAHDPALRLSWSRDVLLLVEKHVAQNSPSPSSTDTPVGPAIITDPLLAQLVQTAVPTVLQLASTQAGPVSAEAVYLRATFSASGAYPDHIQHNPRGAFRDFESAARAGFAQAWFRLGRDYETFNDMPHAKDCFERGVKLGVESCCYRMGMAHMMGQLGLPSNPNLALPLLHRAATLSTPQLPQPAYIFALLLLSEFPSLPAPLPPTAFNPFIPQASTRLLEARRHLERAAYLGFAPAQYKLGHAYEFAQPPFPFDPLLSVQYYSLASQQGEVEADMALSKWFLCGSGEEGQEDDGGFEKDEGLAWTFAEKAARKGLPSAEFAMGYYAEVGVGGPKDLQVAIKWYTRAREHGNTDAAERLAALQQPSPAALSRHEHDTITENKLVRKRTQAKQRSQQSAVPGAGAQQHPPSSFPQPMAPPQAQAQYPQQGQGPPPRMRQDGRRVVEVIRQNSLRGGPQQQPLTPAQQFQQQYQNQNQSHQGRPVHHHQASVPPISGGRPPPLHQQSLPGPQPQQQQQQQQPQHQFAGATRYTLTDAPGPARLASPGGGGGPPQSRPGTGHGRGGALPPPSGLGSRPGGPGGAGGATSDDGHDDEDELGRGATPGLGGGVVYAPKPSKGPTTFAEMGFQGAKAEDKECVIM